jgi:hypothetical protein
MAYEETGESLSMTKSAVLKTTAKDNGLLEKIHEGAYTFGYTKLVPATGEDGVEFGSGAWYDASEKNNTVYATMPTGGTTAPVLAGVFVRQPYIAAGFPARPDRIEPQNKGLICYEGKVKYKTGLAANGTTVQTFATVQAGWGAYISNSTGKVHFAATDPSSGYTKFGKIIRMNPDDSSFTVKVSF